MPPNSDKPSAGLREEVAQRADHRCEYCLCPDNFSPDSFTVDHIYPRALGGRTVPDNLGWACFGCNGRKHVKTNVKDPATQFSVELFNPRQQNWSEHFMWNADNETQLVGITPCGRATVIALDLNRSGVMNLRKLLMLVGLHPPFVVSKPL